MAHFYRKKGEDELALALACGASVDHAAHKSGLTPRTVYRRLSQPAFRQRVQALRADMVQRAAGTMTAASLEAIRTLVELLPPQVPDAVRLGAARTILEVGMKLRQVADFEARLAAVEAQVTPGTPNHPDLRWSTGADAPHSSSTPPAAGSTPVQPSETEEP
jgi:hypothetical protein